METVSVKLPAAVRRKLAAEASRRNVAQSVMRESIERALADSYNNGGPAICAEIADDLIGAIRSGRKDSATNKGLLEEAMSARVRRGPKHRR